MVYWPSVFDRKGFAPFTVPLASLAFFYGLGVRLRLMAYKGIIQKRSLPGTVVSIGNITVGGTGKTPAARMLAEWAMNEGYRVAVLSRGYSGRYRTKILQVSDGTTISAGPIEAGDEPYLLAKRLPGIPVIVSKDRYRAGLLAHRKFKANFFILDDGFQHMVLKRDLDLVLVDASSPFGNGHLLPWGPLREPVDQLKRAHILITTRSAQAQWVDNERMMFNTLFPKKPLFKGDHFPENVVFPGNGIEHNTDVLKGKRITAFAGIARPELFEKTLIQLGAEVLAFKKFKDHHIFNRDEFQKIIAEKESVGADYAVTTEKDWMRLEKIANGYPNLAYLTIRFGLLSGQDRFYEVVKKKVEGRKGV
jgi:tetraacyldisaccharide 4'-kinase